MNITCSQSYNHHSILRSSSFYENLDDPTVHNPLCRGYVRDSFQASVPINHVSTFDIGRAAVKIANNKEQWHGKVITCIASVDSGNDLANVLSSVSGIPVVYQQSPPPLVLRLFLPRLYYMVTVKASVQNSHDNLSDDFKALVPNAMDFKTWLVESQKTWSDGVRFEYSKDATTPKFHLTLPKLVAAVALVAICYKISM